MPSMSGTLINLGTDVVPHLALTGYFALITVSTMTALCARTKTRRRHALEVLRTLLLRKQG
ncbi:hypothetical protein [Rhodococcus sp. NPDC060176]|uniref:hypothetical protein n=2 Tax=unclassified Rhodococcus (in: high G+C Gram-positive bacteria) TaxID=192944 RepID=UPI0012EC62DC